MLPPVAAVSDAPGFPRTRGLADRIGDRVLWGLTGLTAIATVLLLAAIVWKVLDGAWPAIDQFGLSFVWHSGWNATTNVFGARDFIIGTIVTSFVAVLLAGPIAVAIALFLTELAPRAIRGPIGSLVELLAAVPSVVIGLWGILVLAPFVQQHIEPLLQDVLGFLPIFSGPTSPSGVLPAIFVLTIMIIPITSSICRELFTGVPHELKDGALALGATRWEMVRGVIFPYARGGIVAAVILGLGRALGEAIAVTQVIGNANSISRSLFAPGDTLASRIANQYQGAVSNLQVASLVYLAVILLAITLVTNFGAQVVVRRFERQRTGS